MQIAWLPVNFFDGTLYIMVTNAAAPHGAKNNTPVRAITVRVGVIGATLFLIYLGAWATTALVLSNQADGWVKSQRQSGLNIQHGEPVFGGFPDFVTITYPNLNITSAIFPVGWSWTTRAVSVAARPLLLSKLSFNLAGAHTIAIPNASVPNLSLASNRANFDLEFDRAGTISFASLSITELAAKWSTQDALLLNLSEGHFSVRSQNPTLSQSDLPTLALRLKNLNFSRAFPTPMEPTIERINLVIETRLPNITQSLAASLQAWRDNGNVIKVREVEVVWPPISVKAAGTMALDHELQPVGTLSTNVQGLFETLDTLSSKGMIRGRSASMAKIALGLLTRSPPGGGPPELSVSIAVQDKILYVGPVMLTELPAVTWPNKNTRP